MRVVGLRTFGPHSGSKKSTSVSRLLSDELTNIVKKSQQYERARRKALANLQQGYHLGGPQCDPPINKIIAGYNPWKVDREAARLLGLDWKNIGHIEAGSRENTTDQYN